MNEILDIFYNKENQDAIGAFWNAIQIIGAIAAAIFAIWAILTKVPKLWRKWFAKPPIENPEIKEQKRILELIKRNHQRIEETDDPEEKVHLEKINEILEKKLLSPGESAEEIAKTLSEVSASLEESIEEFGEPVVKKAQAALAEGRTNEARALFEEMEKKGEERAAKGAYELGKLSLADYDYFTAYEKFQKAATLQPENHEYHGSAGFMALTLGRYPEAKIFLQTAFDLAQKNDQENHEKIAEYLNNIGSVFLAEGKLIEAREKYEAALLIVRKHFGDSHPDVAIRLNNIGKVLHDEGTLAEAREKYEEALEIDRKHFGDSHPTVAIRLNNIGLVLHDEGKLTEAKLKFEEALEIRLNFFDEDHPKVQTVKRNIAILDKQIAEQKT